MKEFIDSYSFKVDKVDFKVYKKNGYYIVYIFDHARCFIHDKYKTPDFGRAGAFMINYLAEHFTNSSNKTGTVYYRNVTYNYYCALIKCRYCINIERFGQESEYVDGPGLKGAMYQSILHRMEEQDNVMEKE